MRQVRMWPGGRRHTEARHAGAPRISGEYVDPLHAGSAPGPTRRAAAAWLLACALLPGCATAPSAWPPLPPGQLSGRLAVRPLDEPGQGFSGAFDFEGAPDNGRLRLSTPLGTVVAEARWAGERAQFTGPDGSRRSGRLDDLAEDALGERLPVAALLAWVRGQPAAGVPADPLPPPQAGFSQLGWRIDLTQQSEGWVIAERETPPRVRVRIKLDR